VIYTNTDDCLGILKMVLDNNTQDKKHLERAGTVKLKVERSSED
jgi:hypothetical protein